MRIVRSRGRLEQQWPGQEIAVAVVEVGIVGRVLREAVALDPHAVEARGERVADRTGDAAGEAPIVVIAIGDLAGAAEFERGLLRLAADQAGRRIAAADRALPGALHLAAVDPAQSVWDDAGARASAAGAYSGGRGS